MKRERSREASGALRSDRIRGECDARAVAEQTSRTESIDELLASEERRFFRFSDGLPLG